MSQNELREQIPTDRIERPTDADARPDDCQCGEWNAESGLACWPCFRDGFDHPNPDTDEEETSA